MAVGQLAVPVLVPILGLQRPSVQLKGENRECRMIVHRREDEMRVWFYMSEDAPLQQ